MKLNNILWRHNKYKRSYKERGRILLSGGLVKRA